MVTSNLPMISPLVARLCRPIIGSLRSFSSSANKASRASGGGGGGGDGKLPAFVIVEDKNPRRGMGPRSVNPIPNFTRNSSDENIHSHCGHDEESGGATSSGTPCETDVESGHACHSVAAAAHARAAGVIVKQTSVEVIEMREPERGAAAKREIGDYYLVEQSKRDAERLAGQAIEGKRRRSSITFGMGKGA